MMERGNGFMECALTQEKVSSIITWSVRVMIIIAILAFFLPYVSCSAGVTKASISPAVLAVGADKDIEISIFGYSGSETVQLDPQPILFLFMILPIIAGALSLLKEQIAKGLVYLIEGIAFLLFNNHVLRTMRLKLTYGNYDLSRYTLNTEIGCKFYLVHGWAMILLGVAGIVAGITFCQRNAQIPFLSPIQTPHPKRVPSLYHLHILRSPNTSLLETKKSAPKDMLDQADLSASPGSTKLITRFKPVESETGENASDHCEPSHEKDSDDCPFSPPKGF